MPEEDVIARFVAGLLAQRRDWLQGVLARSIRYRVVIAAAVEDKGLPRELRFLPAVESGFQAYAVSPRAPRGCGSSCATRRPPTACVWTSGWTSGGISCAPPMHRWKSWKRTSAEFGDWYLALAAYNCGVGRLAGVIRRNPSAGADFWALRRKGALPRETAAFVPQFLAIARILSYPGPLRSYDRMGPVSRLGPDSAGGVRGPAPSFPPVRRPPRGAFLLQR